MVLIGILCVKRLRNTDLTDLKNEIIKVFKKNDSPLPLSVIAKQMQVDKRLIKKAITELVRSGELTKLKSGRYTSAKDTNLIVGKLDVHPEGYAFLAPLTGGGSDYFVPAVKRGNALNGDIVAVSLEKYKGKTEARVVKIVTRSMQTIVGRIEKTRYATFCVPLDKKFLYDIFIPEAHAAKSQEGDVVIVELTVYPDKKRQPEGKIIRKLGTIDDKGIENEIILAKYNLERNFPKRVLEEVEADAEKLIKNEGKRTDFTKLFTVTIDGESARDFDDAISIEKNDNGYKLYVHIADVSHFVRPETYLDKEALKRGTSTYFLEFAIPMLPERLSNDLCSLRPDEERLTMTSVMDFDLEGRRIGQKFFRSKIKSNHRLTYTYVFDVIEEREKPQTKELADLIENCKDLAERIMKRRSSEGMLDFDLPEPVFEFNKEGDLEDVHPLERNIAHRLIENFMIEANESVAEFLESRIETSIYRVHDKPDMQKLEEYENMCASFGIPVSFGDSADVLAVKEVCDRVAESKFAHVLGGLLVRAMAKAVYSTTNIGHFGLASESYTHFTSPIRRYPDLLVHRLLADALFNDSYKVDSSRLETFASMCSLAEQKSVQAERDIQKFKILKYLYEHHDEPFSAYISRVNSNGLFVFLDKLMVQGYVQASSIEDDYYSLNGDGSALVGKRKKRILRVGDYIEVVTDRVSYDNLEVEFVLGK